MISIFIIHSVILALISMLFGYASIFVCGEIGLIIFCLSSFHLSIKDKRKLLLCSIIAIILCLGIYYGANAKFGNPYWGGIEDGDERMFENAASQMIGSGKTDLLYILDKNTYIRGLNNAKLFVWIMTIIIRISTSFNGYHVLALRLLNIYLMLGASVLFYKSQNKQQNSKYLMLLILFPNILYICSFGFREVLVYYLLACCAIITSPAIKNNNEKRRKLYFLLVPFVLCLYGLRTESIFWGISIIVINTFFNEESELSNKKKIGFIAFAISMMVLASGSGLLSYANNIISNYTEYRLSFNSGLSSYILSANLFPFGAILRILYALANPFPISVFRPFSYIGNFYDFMILLAHIGTVWQLYQLYYIYLGVKRWNRNTFIFLIILASVALTSFTFRHFLFIYPFFFDSVVSYKDQVTVSVKKNVTICTTFLIVMLGLLYFVFK